MRCQRRAPKWMWWGDKPGRNVPSKSGSQCAAGHAQLSLHPREDSPHTAFHQSALAGTAWGGSRGLGGGEQKQGLLGNAALLSSERGTFCPLCSHLGTSERKPGLRRKTDVARTPASLWRGAVGEGSAHLSLIFLLLLFQRHLDEHLLQLLIAVVDHKLLKAIVLKEGTQVRERAAQSKTLPPSQPHASPLASPSL